MIILSRHTKICSFCGKTFIVPGSCQDYLYKRGKLYYCGYNHWLTAERLENPNCSETSEEGNEVH